MTDDSLAGLTERLRHFAAERDWEQFHSPKNLAIGVAAEAGELASQQRAEGGIAQGILAAGKELPAGFKRAVIVEEVHGGRDVGSWNR